MGEYLWDLEVGKDFFDRTQNVLTLKIKKGINLTILTLWTSFFKTP